MPVRFAVTVEGVVGWLLGRRWVPPGRVIDPSRRSEQCAFTPSSCDLPHCTGIGFHEVPSRFCSLKSRRANPVSPAVHALLCIAMYPLCCSGYAAIMYQAGETYGGN